MDFILNGIKEAFQLILSRDPEVYKVIGLSLYVSLTAVFISTLVSVPLGILAGLKNYKGKALLSRILFTLMGMPPVVLGLLVYLFINRRGPLGSLGLIYTPEAMIIAQTLLITPIIMGNIMNSTNAHGSEIKMSLKTLGASKWQSLVVLTKEMRVNIMIAVVTGFGRAISEVGAVMLVGGNVRDRSRVMTTYIAMNTGMGNYSKSIAMGLVLMLLAFVILGVLHQFVIGVDHDQN